MLIENLAEHIRKLKDEDHLSYANIAKKLSMSVEELKKIYIPPSRREKKVYGKQPKSLSVGVISRFLKGEELEKFLKVYQSNKSTTGGQNRGVMLKNPITAEEKELVRWYITEIDSSVKDYTQSKNITISTFYTKVMRTCVRIVAQHPEILDQMVTES